MKIFSLMSLAICSFLVWGCQPQQQTQSIVEPKYTLLFKANTVEVIRTEDTHKPGIEVGEVVSVDNVAEVLKKKGVNPGDDIGGVSYADASRELRAAAIANLITNGWRREQFYTNTKK